MELNKIYQGDCLDVLPTLPDNSVDSIVTDPPYHLTSIVKRFGKENSAPAKFGTDGVFKRASTGFMGKTWDGGDIAFNVDMWKECLRVLKPGGHLLSFSGTRTYHRMAVAIEDAGFEVRDMIEWCYGSGFPKSLNIGKAVDKLQGNEREITGSYRVPDIKGDAYGTMNDKQGGSYKNIEVNKTKGNSEWEGWGTALKPSHEPVVFCSKPLTPRLYFAILIGDISNNIIQLCQISNVKDAEKIFSGIQAKLEKEGVLSVADNVRINAWESLENVKFAEKSFTSKEQKSSDLTKTKENSAQLNAKQNGKKDNLQEIKTLAGVEANIKALMDIIIFGTTENTSQNIALLWNSISEELLNQANTLTISMATRLITDLKILKLSATQSILESTGSLFKTPQNIPPNHEPICMARKPLSEKTVVENVLKWGTGGINIDESRVNFVSEEDRKESTTKNQHADFGTKPMTNNNVYGDYSMIQPKNFNPTGRFPANLILDTSEEVRECFPETKTGGVGKGRDSKGKFYGGGFHNPETYNGGDSGNASRFFKSIKKPYVYSGKEYEVDGFVKKCKPQAPSNYNDEGSPAKYFKSIIYQAKASKSERNKGMDSLEAKPMYKEDRKNNHPTVKPVALMEYLIKMITPKGGIVLEPFAGSGSTLVAAKENGFNFIGIELTEDYIPIIEARTGVKAEKIQPIENVIQKTQTEPTSVIKEKPINTQKPKNDIDTCECGGRIVKTSSGSKICDNCFRTF